MTTFTFIKENTFGDSHDITPILAISNEIETLKLWEAYDNYGQLVGHSNAGDYSIKNNHYSDAYWDMLSAIRKRFNLDENLDFDIDVEDLTATEEIGVDAEELKSFCTNWRSENEFFNEVKGFNYWDGNNWKTVITDDTSGEPSHFIIDENIEALNKAIEDATYIKGSFGKTYYESEDYWLIQSAFSQDFESYQIYPKSEVDLEDLN